MILTKREILKLLFLVTILLNIIAAWFENRLNIYN